MAKFSFVSAVLPVVVLCLSLYLQLPERLILPVIRVFFDISHSSTPTVHDKDLDVKYRGISSDKAEIFQNVFYGADTAGQGRFAPPIRFTPAPGSVVDATTPGAMCPQAKGDAAFPFTSPTTNISENCLSLKIARPTRTSSMANLPVIVYLHGGGAILGSGGDQMYRPDGLIQQSVTNGQPVIFVGVNYRLGVFGFAATKALRKAKQMNNGLRDQIAALEWVRDHIKAFGGDPGKVTVVGQSVGAAHVALHMTSYAGRKGVPFQRAVLMSGASGLNFNIDGSVVADNTASVAQTLKCVKGDAGSEATIDCLRNVSIDALTDASIELARTLHPPFGELSFYPSQDDDYIPKRPSLLLREGKFVKGIPVIASWTANDGAWYAPPTTAGDEAIGSSFAAFAVNLKPETLRHLVSLYPASTFAHKAERFASTTIDYWRAAQLHRDAWFTCPGIAFTWQLAKHGNPNVHLFEMNATKYTPVYKAIGVEHWGVAHLSDIPYVLNNEIPDSAIPIDNSPEQTKLSKQLSGSVIAFAYEGDPTKSKAGTDVLGDWSPAYSGVDKAGLKKDFPERLTIQVVGGPHSGGSAKILKGGRVGANELEKAVEAEDLFSRCAFIDSIVDEIGV